MLLPSGPSIKLYSTVVKGTPMERTIDNNTTVSGSEATRALAVVVTRSRPHELFPHVLEGWRIDLTTCIALLEHLER